jgi:Tfp pilus assembly protein PilF
MLENLAQVQFALNQKAAAVETLRKALALDPANTEYRELLTRWAGSAASVSVQPTEPRRRPFATLW